MMECEVVFGMDAKVIHVNLEPSFGDHVCEDMIHECLKGWWSIAKTKEHDSGFVETKRSDEHCLPLILLFDMNIVVAPMDVELGKQGGLLHVINQFRNEGEGVSVVNGMAIEVSVILARM